MAEYHLISQDAVVNIYLGQAASGAAPTYATTPIIIIGDEKNFRVREPLETVNVSGIGDTRRKLRAKRGATDIEIEAFVLSSGCAAEGKVGYYAKLEKKHLSSITSVVTYAGLITEWEWSGADDEQAERIAIECDAETA